VNIRVEHCLSAYRIISLLAPVGVLFSRKADSPASVLVCICPWGLSHSMPGEPKRRKIGAAEELVDACNAPEMDWRIVGDHESLAE